MYRLAPMPLISPHWCLVALFCRIFVHGVVVLTGRSVGVGLRLLFIFFTHAAIHFESSPHDRASPCASNCRSQHCSR
uniref:Uncharacterized protein n=1 Tax=Arundo donax TaxID=35708 RepID=A0A0A9GDN3_ARUDO